MRILHVIATIDKSSGGTTTALKNILQLEKLLGYELEVLTIATPDSDKSLDQYAIVHYTRSSIPERYSRSKEALLWFDDHHAHYDVVHIHGIWSFLPCEISRRAYVLHVPYIISPHGSLDPFDLQKKSTIKKFLGPRIIAPILQGSHSILCTSDLEAERLITYGANPPKYSLPLPIPVSDSNGNRARFRAKYAINNGDIVLLFLSRIDYKKGLDILIRAFAEVAKKHHELKLVIAGSDSHGYELKVRRWVIDLHLENRVYFTGFLSGEEKWDAFAGSDCFVLPSQNENFGIAVVEALSAGLPVIISENVYIRKEIFKVDCGWVCRCSTSSLTEILYTFLQNEDERKMKSIEAPRAAHLFAPEVLGPSYRKYFEGTIWRHCDQ